MNSLEQIMERTQWFRHDRFGLFIHWGLYAIPARGEWVRSTEQMPAKAYEPLREEFNPVDFDPRAWARAAREAGMRYAVLTAKHHDGFCLFDSQYTDFKSTNTPCGRDLVREFLDAFRAEGLKVGLYYSLIDWHHPDYPAKGDRTHPLRETGRPADAPAERFDRYLAYMHGQVEELATRYGKLDIMWFDFSYEEMMGEKWRATELIRMLRSHQPHVITDNRLEASGEGFGSIATGKPTEYSGDFVSPEQIIPPQGLTDALGRPIPWECCLTMNNNWGYCQFDDNFKSPRVLIRKLVECVSKGGNMLLNVGPDARGNIPPRSLEIMAEIGRWLRANGDSIYGAGPADYPKPDYGRLTAKGDKLYLHVMEETIGPVPFSFISKERIARVRLLSTGAELPIADEWTTRNYPEYSFIALGKEPMQTYALPDGNDTVIELTLKP